MKAERHVLSLGLFLVINSNGGRAMNLALCV